MQYRILSVDPIDPEDERIVIEKCEWRITRRVIEEYHQDPECTRVLVAEPVADCDIVVPSGKLISGACQIDTMEWLSMSRSARRFAGISREQVSGARFGDFDCAEQRYAGLRWSLETHFDFAFDQIEKYGSVRMPWLLCGANGRTAAADAHIRVLSGKYDGCVACTAQILYYNGFTADRSEVCYAH